VRNWFRRKKKEEEYDDYEDYEIYNSEIPLPTLLRWFIYDTGHSREGLDKLIGLMPTSEEGAEKEAQDSSERVIEIEPLVPFIDFMSDAASVMFSSLGESFEEDIPDDVREETEEMLATLYKSISIHSMIGAFSIANALGLIHITTLSSELGLAKEDYDE
jgi:hypothetical protein